MNLNPDKCNCIKSLTVNDAGKAVITPDYTLLSTPSYSVTPLEGCFCPRTVDELKKCLSGCLQEIMNKQNFNANTIKSVFILNESGREEKF